MSTSLATLLADFIHEYGIGYAGTCTSNGTTTTLIDTNHFQGPLPGGLVPNGSPIRITSGTNIDASTYKSNIDPTTGTITVLQALANASATNDTFVLATGVNHMDRIVEAVTRALTRRCTRILKVPLTAIPDGDFLGSQTGVLATAHWSASVGTTLSYQMLSMSEGWTETALRVLNSGTSGTATSDSVGVEPGEQREGLIFMRSQAGTDTASFVLNDVSNTAVITPVFSYGTGSTTEQMFTCQRFTYQVPAGCSQINYQLSFAGTAGHWAEFGCVLDAGDNQKSFALQPHIRSENDIMSWQRARLGPTATSGPSDMDFEPVSDDGVGTQNFGWGIGVEWDFPPPFPMFYEEYCAYPSMSLSTDTTNCPEEMAICATAIELFEMQIRQSGEKPTFYRGRVLPTTTMLKLQSAQELWNSGRLMRLRAQRRVDIKRTYGRGVMA